MLLLIATLASAAAGVGIATMLVPETAPAPAPAAAGRVLAGDLTRLALPDGWEPLRRSTIPGLDGAPSARGLYSDVSIDERMPDHSSLLPAPLLQQLGVQAPAPELMRSGGRVVWAYGMRGSDDETRITALVLPTTRGVVSVVCLADELLSPFEATDCEAALAALDLVGAAPLRPAAETAVQLTAGPVIAKLDDERIAGRRALAAARSPSRREALALRLAAAYAAAARRLEPLARGTARPLPRSLGELARSYRSLARASARRQVRSALRAGRTIDRRERQLAAQLSPAQR